jgi:K+-transporting ATPase KdpF subunit
MNIIEIISFIVAILLAIFMFFAMLFPEKL